jgi:endoglycosylceramidase
MWEAVETAPGVYNDTYLGVVDDMITRLGKAGIYTLIDGHQDVISRMTCGEGMPYFHAQEVLKNKTLQYCFGPYTDMLLAPIFKLTGLCESIDNYNMRKDKNGVPLLEDCQKVNFFHYYYTLESIILYRALYKNDMGIQDKWVAYWEKLAESLGKNQYVIGMDPMNEPFPSWNTLEDCLSTIYPGGGNFDKHDLQPMYKRAYEAYAKHS